MIFGYDNFNDIRNANNHQSGSDYRIFGTDVDHPGHAMCLPEFLGDGTTIIQWNPIPILSEGSNFRTHSVFFNDSWRVNDRLTANLGLRYDKNDGKNQAGELVVEGQRVQPAPRRRSGIRQGTGDWSVTASFAKYVAAVSNTIADSSSAAGNPQTWQFLYRGPTSTRPARPRRRRMRSARCGRGSSPRRAARRSRRPDLPAEPADQRQSDVARRLASGLATDLTTPNNIEYAVGVSRQFGARAALRADYVFRDYQDFYVRGPTCRPAASPTRLDSSST